LCYRRNLFGGVKDLVFEHHWVGHSSHQPHDALSQLNYTTVFVEKWIAWFSFELYQLEWRSTGCDHARNRIVKAFLNIVLLGHGETLCSGRKKKLEQTNKGRPFSNVETCSLIFDLG
jgi:hypothetical protein